MRPIDSTEFNINHAFYVNGTGYTLPVHESCFKTAIENEYIRVFRDEFEDEEDIPVGWVRDHLKYHKKGKESPRHVKFKIRAARYLESLHHTVERIENPHESDRDWIYGGFEITDPPIKKEWADVGCKYCDTFVECGGIAPDVGLHAFGFIRDGEQLIRRSGRCVDNFITLSYPYRDGPPRSDGKWTFFIFRPFDLPEPHL